MPGRDSSDREETNVLVRRLHRLVRASENNPPVVQALGRINNDINLIIAAVSEPEGVTPPQILNPIIKYSLLGGVAVVIATGLLKNINYPYLTT